MTEQEYEDMKLEIIKAHGKPEYDMHDPVNESARLLMKLKDSYAEVKRAGNRREKLAKLAGELDSKTVKAGDSALSIPAPDLSETDLSPFTPSERLILVCYFENLNQSHKQIATKLGIAYQTVTTLLQSKRFQLLYQKVFDHILPLEAVLALRLAMKKGDTKVTLEVARSYGLLKAEQLDLNVGNKPLEDNKASSLLKTLGDKLAKDNTL